MKLQPATMKNTCVKGIMMYSPLIIYAQVAIIAAGNQTETIGETFPLMQQVDTVIQEVSLSVPKFETHTETQKPIVKKKLSFWQKILKFFNFK